MKRSLRSWLWGVPLKQKVDDEIAFHVEMRTRELVERGVDVTSAFRQMRAFPGFTAVAVLTLALGIGANSAIFAIADATFLRPLPFTSPHDRLVMLWERYPNGFLSQVTPLDFADWADQNQSFDAMASFLANSVAMIGPDGTAEQVTSQTVSLRFFDILGVTPIAGRTFVASDAVEPNSVVLSEGFWRRRFGADPTLVGRALTIAGRPQTVIGIVPDGFRLVPATISTAGSEPPSLWTVFNYPRSGDPTQRAAHYMYAVGRIKEGVAFDAAQRDMTAIGKRNEELYPQTNTGHVPTLQPLREALVGSEMRVTSMLLLAVVGFVLLMCCANVANLLLARTMSRTRELAVRSALGASRRRIVSQILTESLVLASVGGLVGMVIGAAILSVAPAPTRYPTPEAVHGFYDAIEREVAKIAGVQSVAIGGALPLDGMFVGQGIDIEGDPPRQGPSRKFASYHMVSPTYFEALDIPIVSGRTFSATDRADGVEVCIVSEGFVQRYLKGRNPIGLRVAVPAMAFPVRPVLREIVGVATPIKMFPNEAEPIPQI